MGLFGGLFDSIFGGGEKNQTITNQLDPATQQRNEEIFNRARQVSNTPYQGYGGPLTAGANPLSQEATTGMRDAMGQFGYLGQSALNANAQAQMTGQGLGNLGFGLGQQGSALSGVAGGFDQQGRQMGQWAGAADQRANQSAQFGQQFQPYAHAGRLGARALGGDSSAAQQFMNPYQQQVLNSVGGDFDRLRSQASMQSNQAATQAGAFGGSRHGVMEGARLGELDSSQASTMAQLRQGGFNDAMGRAGQAANLGFGAGQMDLSGRQLGQADRAQGLQAQQVGQGFNQLGMGARQLGAQYQGMGLDARGMGLQAQQIGLGALGQAQGAMQGQLGAAGQLGAMGDYYRQVQQQGLDSQYNQFLDQRGWDANQLGILRGAASGMPYGTSQTQPIQRDPLGGLLGIASTVGGFLTGGASTAAAGAVA